MNILGEDPVTFVDAALVVRRHFIRSVCSLDSEHFVWENVVLSNTSPWIVQTSPYPIQAWWGANAPLLLVIVGSGNGSSLFDAGQTIS